MNKEKIVITTPVVHAGGCGTSGTLKCQDYLHNKVNWGREDIDLLIRVLDNYIRDEEDYNQNQ